MEAIGLWAFLERKAGRLELGRAGGQDGLDQEGRPYLGFNKIALIYEERTVDGKDKNSGIIKETIAVIPKQNSFFIVSK